MHKHNWKTKEDNLPNLYIAVKKKDFIKSEFYSRYSNIFLDVIEGVEYHNDNILAAKVLDIGAELRELKKNDFNFNSELDTIKLVFYNTFKDIKLFIDDVETHYNINKFLIIDLKFNKANYKNVVLEVDTIKYDITKVIQDIKHNTLHEIGWEYTLMARGSRNLLWS